MLRLCYVVTEIGHVSSFCFFHASTVGNLRRVGILNNPMGLGKLLRSDESAVVYRGLCYFLTITVVISCSLALEGCAAHRDSTNSGADK